MKFHVHLFQFKIWNIQFSRCSVCMFFRFLHHCFIHYSFKKMVSEVRTLNTLLTLSKCTKERRRQKYVKILQPLPRWRGLLTHWPSDTEKAKSCWLMIVGETKRAQPEGRQLIDTSGPCLVSKHPSPRQRFPVAVYTHLIPPAPVPPSPPSVPSSTGPLGRHAYQCFMRGWGEGTRDWERYRGRESAEGGLGSAARPKQQSESIKSVGLLLHWVVINRSWTLSPARRADRVNEGPKAAPYPPPSPLLPIPLSSLLSLFVAALFG